MKILFITNPAEDYLPDALLHGLKELHGPEVVDFPKCEILYRGCAEETIAQVRGRGFTLYSGLLDDLPVNRFRIIERVRDREFSLVIFGSIWRQYGWYLHLKPWLDPRKTIFIDGEDGVAGWPAGGRFWKHPYYWLVPQPHRRSLYFKREWTGDTHFSNAWRLLPAPVRRVAPPAANLRPIGFSIPAEKIVTRIPEKSKDFPVHIVDEEIASLTPGSKTRYAFNSEAQYYEDLQCSRFGITTKRGGWECLRHYEIAANGAVPCFRDLDKKPRTCAPHGLDSSNSISYSSAADLAMKLRNLNPAQYASLQDGALTWVKEHTTRAEARRVLESHRDFIRDGLDHDVRGRP